MAVLPLNLLEKRGKEVTYKAEEFIHISKLWYKNLLCNDIAET